MSKLLKCILILVALSFLIGGYAHAGADIDYSKESAEYESLESSDNKNIEDLSEIDGFNENLLNIQERLAMLGYYPTYLVDGTYREPMKASIKRFQKDYGLKIDGIFGLETAVKLNYYTGTQHVMPISHYKTVYYYSMPGHYAGF